MKNKAQKFADDTGISVDLASRLLKRLDKKALSVLELNSLIYRLKDWFVKNEFAKTLEKASDATIDTVINEMVMERKRFGYPEAAFSEAKMWMFHTLEFGEKKHKKGDVVEVQIMRKGTWNHGIYGEVSIDEEVIQEMVQNFAEGKRGIDIAVDENHDPNHKALGWIREVYSMNDDTEAWAKIELTERGAVLLNEGAYKYFSPEFVREKEDEETGETHRNLLIGGAFTNRPFFKAMQPLLASEEGAEHGDAANGEQMESLIFSSTSSTMFKFLEALNAIAKAGSKPTKAQLDALTQQYSELSEADQNRADIKSKYEEALAMSEEEQPEKPEGESEKPEGEKPEGEEEKPEGEGEKPEGEKPEGEKPEGEAPAGEAVKANEDGTVTIKASELNDLKAGQRQLSKLVKEKRERTLKDKVAGLQFSETNKVSVILPKSTQKIVDFAATLNEKQEEKFFEILTGLNTLAAQEFGAEGEGGQQFDEGTKQWYMTHMQMSEEAAAKAAEDYKKTSAKK